MNILLVNPHFKKKEKAYPLGLGYIGAVLKQGGHKVFGADLSFSSFDDVLSLIRAKEIDLIGVSLMSFSFDNALLFCRKVKGRRPVPVVAGGPHATAFKEKLLQDDDSPFDYLLIGEGERSFLVLVDSIEHTASLDGVMGLIYRDNGKIVVNEKTREEDDLDQLPFSDRTIFSVLDYKGMFAADKEYTQIITSRGCNDRCGHCPEPLLWDRWRGRSPENVVLEIKRLIDDFGIRDIHIEDSNFFGGGAERIKDLCLKLIDEVVDIKWQCPNGIPVSDLEDGAVFKWMAQAGCYNVCLGIETFDQGLLKALDRSSYFEKTKQIVEAAHKAGIEVVGYFMIGLPGQTFKSVINDFGCSWNLDLDFVHYSVFHLIPGSQLYCDEGLHGKKGPVFGRRAAVLWSLRAVFSFFYCFRSRVVLYNLKRLMTDRNPFRFIRRVVSYIFGVDLKY